MEPFCIFNLLEQKGALGVSKIVYTLKRKDVGEARLMNPSHNLFPPFQKNSSKHSLTKSVAKGNSAAHCFEEAVMVGHK